MIPGHCVGALLCRLLRVDDVRRAGTDAAPVLDGAMYAVHHGQAGRR